MKKQFIMSSGHIHLYYIDEDCTILHREDGPAVDYCTVHYGSDNKYNSYYLNGINYPSIKDDRHWLEFIKTIIFI